VKPTNIQNQVRKIRELLLNQAFEEAFEKLEDLAQRTDFQEDFEDEIFQLQFRHTDFQKKSLNGTANDKEEQNQIIEAFSKLLRKIEKDLTAKFSDVPEEYSEKQFIPLSEPVSEQNLSAFLKIFQEQVKNINLESSENQSDELHRDAMLLREEIEKILDKNLQNRSHILFDRVLIEPQLNPEIIKEVRDVAKNDKYPDHEKAMLVGALTLSLVQKFDPERVDLLLDFLNEFRENVWQRALVGLVLGLYNRDKKLTLYPNLMRKLRNLQQIEEVQDGLYVINDVFYKKNHKKVQFLETKSVLENHPYFKKVQNWFIPFYPKNEILKQTLENTKHNIGEDFIEILNRKMLVSDTIRFAFCLNLENYNNQAIDNLKNLKSKRSKFWVKNWIYFEYLTDLYLFYSIYNPQNLQSLFAQKIEIYDASLLDILAGEKYKLKIQAETFNNLENYEKAIFLYQRYLEIEPNSQKVWVSLGTVYHVQENYKKAIKCYKKCIEIKSDYHWAWYFLGHIHKTEINYQKAIEYYERCLETKPDYHQAWSGLGDIYKSQKNHEKAIESYEKCLEIKSDYHWAWNNLGDVYRENKNYEKSEECYQKSIEIKPNHQDTWNDLGLVYEDQKNYKKAIESYEKCLEIKSDYHWAWNNLGVVYENQKNYKKAIESYEKCLEIKSDYHWAWNNLGDVYRENKNYEKSEECYQKSIEIKPNHQDTWNDLGLVYEDQKNYKKAIESYEKCLEIKSDYHWAWNNLGDVYRENKNYEKSEECYQKSIEINPEYASGYFNLGWLYFIQGKFEASKKQFLKSWELDKNTPQTPMNLGHIALQQGKEAEAEKLYFESLALFEKEDKRDKFFEGMEDDFQYLAPYGVSRQTYDALLAKLQKGF